MFDFSRMRLFCLEKRLSKHRMAIFSKNLGGEWPLWPPLTTPMDQTPLTFSTTLLITVHTFAVVIISLHIRKYAILFHLA